jgi:hypothetical protein
MKTDSGSFALALLKSRNSFEDQFLLAAVKLRLEETLRPKELYLLYTAAFYVAACNISINDPSPRPPNRVIQASVLLERYRGRTFFKHAGQMP